ncbi:MAG: HPr family phosphocarrier protein [Pseudomonadota bacterium]|jgi:Phosphotransferase System HPr (HPr) Family|nr:MAG: HPr family phosphocarrier protein [Pseudomonadota bacterium]
MTGRIKDESAVIEGSAIVNAPDGLHARPAIRLSRLARQFEAHIRVRANGAGEWVDAKSIVRLMGLRVAYGTRLDFLAQGRDAERAVDELRKLVGRNFDESDGHGGT